MRFEERVTVLCAQALATDDEADIRKLLAELRLVLHQHIEGLRSGLLVAYAKSMMRTKSVEETRGQPAPAGSGGVATAQHAGRKPPRTWQQVVREIACERDHERALQLSRKLNLLLQQRHRGAPGSC